MNMENNYPLMRHKERCVLTWIVQIENLSDLSKEIRSPKFETAGNIDWRINLSTGISSGEDDLFCTLTRLLDRGPSEVHYALCCKVFIGDERPEDRNCKMQPLGDKTFREGSSLVFRLLPLSHVRKSVAAHLSSEPVKLIVKIQLQRKSFGSVRPVNSLLACDDLKVFSSTKNCHCPHVFYGGKESECIPEEKHERQIIPHNLENNYAGIFHCDSERSQWLTTYYEMNLTDCMIKCQVHILDVNGVILTSSKARTMDIGPFLHRFDLLEKEEVKKNLKILTRDGEATVRWELAVATDVEPEIVCMKWACAFPCRNVCNLRSDLKQLRQNRIKSTNFRIRADEKVFGIHKEIIAARSSTFKAMLSNAMAEKLSNVVEIKDVDSETVKNFLNFVYWGAFDNSMECEDACDLYVIAAKYFVHSLKHACSSQLISCISCDNCKKLSVLAHLFEDHELQFTVDSFDHLNPNDYAICPAIGESLMPEGDLVEPMEIE